MSDISRPESATASLTAVSAWAASGMSAERVTWENPTPLTATLHRFSHIVPLLNLSVASITPTLPSPIKGEGRAGSPKPLPLDGGGWEGVTPGRPRKRGGTAAG